MRCSPQGFRLAANLLRPPLCFSARACALLQAYAAVAAVESKYLISTGQTYATRPLRLSVQQLLDCASNLGCQGGGET